MGLALIGKLTICFNEDYGLKINHKKVYRLCKKLGVLHPQRKLKGRKPKKLAKKVSVHGPDWLCRLDIHLDQHIN